MSVNMIVGLNTVSVNNHRPIYTSPAFPAKFNVCGQSQEPTLVLKIVWTNSIKHSSLFWLRNEGEEEKAE